MRKITWFWSLCNNIWSTLLWKRLLWKNIATHLIFCHLSTSEILENFMKMPVRSCRFPSLHSCRSVFLLQAIQIKAINHTCLAMTILSRCCIFFCSSEDHMTEETSAGLRRSIFQCPNSACRWSPDGNMDVLLKAEFSPLKKGALFWLKRSNVCPVCES